MQISVNVFEVEFGVLPHLNAVRESFCFCFHFGLWSKSFGSIENMYILILHFPP